MKLSQRQLGFLEGLIDGEGSIGFWKRKRPALRAGYELVPVLQISNTNRNILVKARLLIGAGSIGLRLGKENRKDYVLVVYSNGIRHILPQLSFIIKERQRCLVLEALKLLHRGRHIDDSTSLKLLQIWEQMRRLNRRGKSDGIQ